MEELVNPSLSKIPDEKNLRAEPVSEELFDETTLMKSVEDKSSRICKVCGKTFRKDNLKRHMKTHLHACDVCPKTFAVKHKFDKHKIMHTSESLHVCDVCQKTFKREFNLKRHRKIQKSCKEHICGFCSETFRVRSSLIDHVRTTHKSSCKRKGETFYSGNKREKKTKHILDVFRTYELFADDVSNSDLTEFLREMHPQIKEKLIEELNNLKALKWYMVVMLEMVRTVNDPNEEEETITTHFRSNCLIELTEDFTSDHIDEGFCKINKSFEVFTHLGSGWSLQKIIKADLYIAKYHPLKASSYIPLPSKLEKKKAVLNIQNLDNKCFIWCLLAHKMNIENNPQRDSHYTPHENNINLGNVDCPVPISKVPVIERLNNLRINIYGYDDEEVFPLYVSKQTNSECINLLLISKEGRQHYCLIRNMSRLLGDLTKHDGETYYCCRCLHRFSEKKNLDVHLDFCKNLAPQRVKFPDVKNNELSFSKHHFQHKLPFIIYADFESLILPISSSSMSPNQSYSEKTAKHVPCGYAFVVIDHEGKTYKPISCYRGEDSVEHFLKEILIVKDELTQKMYTNNPLKMTPEQERKFQSETHCFLCKKELHKDRVRDHDHITSEYRGALHNACNLKYRMKKTIPIVFHNLKNYDCHLIMSALGKIQNHEFNVIATNMEKYITFSIVSEYKKCRVQLQFIDSFQFLATSLEKLVDNLPKNNFKILNENIPQNSDLLLKKGIYPYEYMSSFQKFEETDLPPKPSFYSSLTEENISNDDYLHAQNVWQTFKIKNMGEYHDLYVKTDVLQLADVFENFRSVCLKYYDLDCAHLFTSAGLAWQACLKMCDQPLELLTDANMHLLIENGIRGGISTITHRWAQSNNKYLENYDVTKPSSYIMYLDANNLYGWAMCQPLPVGNFEWISTEGIDSEWILSTPDDGSEGYVFQVDLEIPKELHNFFNEYPPAPEKVEICREMLSPYNRALVENTSCKTLKLTPNLNDKKNYVVLFQNLKFYLTLGLKLTRIHKILKFSQKPWLKNYIEFNTEQRKLASSSFEKDFFKLLNNSVYGKTMENVRKHKDILLVNDSVKAEKLVAAPTFRVFSTFNDNLVGVERLKKTVYLNKPLYVGFAILELSKLHMYRFHYNYIKQRYGSKSRLLFTDTDSLTYHIETEDVYNDMMENPELFDTSDYPKEHPLYSINNKKKIGCFKDETNSECILEFVGLRSKMYSILTKKYEKKTAKGVTKSFIRNKVKHTHYKECLFNSSKLRGVQSRIQSFKHDVYSMKINKITLSSFDDKRYILEDGVESLAYGHCKI